MERENNYDLLRIVSAVAVIMIHVSATWFTSAVKDVSEKGLSIMDINEIVNIGWHIFLNQIVTYAASPRAS